MLNGRTVKSCTVLTVAADGGDVLTVEGLDEQGEMSPVQKGFQACHGLQCGYCTPGMVMAATGMLLEQDDPDEAAIREGLEGNLCRCTGYDMIVDSVRWAAEHGGPGRAALRHKEGQPLPGPADVPAPPSGSLPEPSVTP
jgi:carbon-monoxide dehydrogenase small subunit